MFEIAPVHTHIWLMLACSNASGNFFNLSTPGRHTVFFIFSISWSISKLRAWTCRVSASSWSLLAALQSLVLQCPRCCAKWLTVLFTFWNKPYKWKQKIRIDWTRFNLNMYSTLRGFSQAHQLCVFQNFQVKLLSDHLDIGFDGAANLTFAWEPIGDFSDFARVVTNTNKKRQISTAQTE